MSESQTRYFDKSPYYVMTEEIDKGKDYCKHLTVKIFDQRANLHEAKQVGSYKRLYGSLYNTFFPFQNFADGKWYALYSADYTTTRVMSLPDCKDLAGEESASNGFCPTGFYVPTAKDLGGMWDEDPSMKDIQEALEKHKLTQFGFLCGCVWGDDSSWKIRFIPDVMNPSSQDLFGYVELADEFDLKDSISFNDFSLDPDDGGPWIKVAHAERFHLKTGEKD